MNVTSFWQSLELLQAGLDRKTADFVYERDYETIVFESEDGSVHYNETDGGGEYVPRPRTDNDSFNTDLIPAWSLGRLWEVVGKVANFDFDEKDSPNSIIEKLIKLYKNAIH